MKMQKSVSVVPLLLLLCLSGVGVTKGQGVEVTKAVDFKTEFEVKTPADRKTDGQTDSEPDLWAELRALRDMGVAQRVEKREAVMQSQLEDVKTQKSDLQAQRVRPTAELSVRLVDGTTSCSGTVEVFSRGEWSGLCTGWSMRDTKVVCRQLDCGNVVAESGGPLVEDGRRGVRLICKGHESSIRQCGIRGGGPGVCVGRYYHHVICSESVRLVDGAGLCSGRVEVKSNQSWASVCEADFDRQDAEVVCGELGCGAPAALQGGLYGGGEGQTWDKEFQCKGKESLLLDCDTSDRKHNTCLPGNAVGLTCSEPDDVRLVGGGSRCAGGVEWYDQGEWRTVGTADRDWNQENVAAVVCRQLGCDSTVSVIPGNTTRGFRVHCSGSESSLRECSRMFYPRPGLTVICSDLQAQRVRPPAELSVRLVNGTTSCSGTVEVFYRGEWSGLCTGWWSMMIETKVMCRELDCGNPVSESQPLFEEGRGGVRLYSRCSGNESSIRQCDRIRRPGVCYGGYYHHVICSESVRLVDGAGLCSGRVEVKSNQSWASVCEADFDRQDAEVVCRDVGCGAPAALQGGLYGGGEGQTWDKEFQCKGKESLLLDCDTSDRENNTCLPGNAVGLTCSDLLVQPDISLTDSMGGVSRGHQGPEVFRGYSFTITCSTQPQYPGGSFLLTFTGSNRTQTQPAVNHSAAFLFPAADDSHQGNYSSSPLPAFIIRHVVVLLLLLTAITTSYLYYKPTRRQKRVNRVSSMDLYVNAMETVSLSSRAEAGPGGESSPGDGVGVE
ncbi:scavenger receptor cysteine-rich type 1 protein M130-like [Salvelinus fontinalis]|uniref:scavenger receptor cysteine-rich type 1 protein M130-like n=1 Tax=Salvelinus fontinalis TaxID=8038 RepID=UPI002484DBDF|nr:scavenger receptor cysteine-rich type 1 protein M130-like [Salvelinus fontinalis]